MRHPEQNIQVTNEFHNLVSVTFPYGDNHLLSMPEIARIKKSSKLNLKPTGSTVVTLVPLKSQANQPVSPIALLHCPDSTQKFDTNIVNQAIGKIGVLQIYYERLSQALSHPDFDFVEIGSFKLLPVYQNEGQSYVQKTPKNPWMMSSPAIACINYMGDRDTVGITGHVPTQINFTNKWGKQVSVPYRNIGVDVGLIQRMNEFTNAIHQSERKDTTTIIRASHFSPAAQNAINTTQAKYLECSVFDIARVNPSIDPEVIGEITQEVNVGFHQNSRQSCTAGTIQQLNQVLAEMYTTASPYYQWPES